MPRDETKKKADRPVVGLGLMQDAGRYSLDRPDNAVYLAYLDTLAIFVQWLLAHGWDIRLLTGDVCDRAATQAFRSLLKERSVTYEEGRIIDEPIVSARQLLLQLAKTDVVVATRFHNILLALLLNKPVISISFHHKCASLMSRMGLSEYCQDMNGLKADQLIELFCRLEKNAGMLKPMIGQNAEGCRKALDDQYNLIFQDLGIC
jgi:polysaccharide pyruvyl transferase WcaK-like protein